MNRTVKGLILGLSVAIIVAIGFVLRTHYMLLGCETTNYKAVVVQHGYPPPTKKIEDQVKRSISLECREFLGTSQEDLIKKYPQPLLENR